MPIFPSSILSSHSAEQSHERDLKFYRELEKAGTGGAAIAFLGVPYFLKKFPGKLIFFEFENCSKFK